MLRSVTALAIVLTLCCGLLVASGCLPSNVLSEETLPTGEGSMADPPFSFLIEDAPFEKEHRGMRIIIDGATSQGAFIRFENDNKLPVGFGYTFLICVFKNGNWELVHPRKGIAYPALFTTKFPLDYLDFDFFFDGLEPGSYRVAYRVSILETNASGEDQSSSIDYRVYLYTDFTILNR